MLRRSKLLLFRSNFGGVHLYGAIKSTELGRFIAIAPLIFCLGLLQFELIYRHLPAFSLRATVSWWFNFLLGTLWSHALHRCFTFRDAPQRTYLASLARTYLTYLSTLVFGSILLHLLCDRGAIDPTIGWCLATVASSSTNYVLLRFFAIVA